MIDLSFLDNKQSIWIAVSGGTDSALLLYLVTQYLYRTNQQKKITPWTCVDTSRPGNDIDVDLIKKCIQQIYPYKFEPTIVNTFYKEPGGDKPALTRPFWNKLAESGNYDVYMNALTSSPTREQMESIPGFFESFSLVKPELRLPTGNKITIANDTKHNLIISQPFINLNKGSLADIYESENLMDNLFPLTKSCVDRHTTPCYNCFWCYEKHWAFGLYDIKQTKFN